MSHSVRCSASTALMKLILCSRRVKWLTSVNKSIVLSFNELSAASQGLAVGERRGLAMAPGLICTLIYEIIETSCHANVQPRVSRPLGFSSCSVTCVWRTLTKSLVLSCCTSNTLQYVLLLIRKLKGRHSHMYTILNCMTCQMPKPRLLK